MWEFLTSDSSPWWTGLLGVVLGAVFGLVGVRAADKRRFAREDRQRWDQPLLDATVGLLDLWRVTLDRRPAKGHADNDERVGEFSGNIEKLHKQTQVIELLGSPDLSSKAVNAVMRLDEYCDPGVGLADERDNFESRRLHKEAWAAREDFLAQARASLGVRSVNGARRS